MYLIRNYPHYDGSEYFSSIAPSITLLQSFGVRSLNIVKRAPHSHPDEAEIIFALTGGGSVIINNKEYILEENDIVVYNQDTFHDDSNIMSMHLVMRLNNLNIPGLPENHIIPAGFSPVIHTGHMSSYFIELWKQLSHIAQTDTFDECGLVNTLTLSLVNAIRQLCFINSNLISDNDNDISESVRMYMKENYMRDLTLESVSNEFHISQSMLSHIFKDRFGISPMQYLTRVRIGAAQIMLLESDESIANIAFSVGYNNLSNFITAFKKLCDMRPSEFKQYVIKSRVVDEIVLKDKSI